MTRYALVFKQFADGICGGGIAYEWPSQQGEAETRYTELLHLAAGDPLGWTPRFFVGEIDFETETRLLMASGIEALTRPS